MSSPSARTGMHSTRTSSRTAALETSPSIISSRLKARVTTSRSSAETI